MNLEEKHVGKYFSANICSSKDLITGKIQKENGKFYLCQNVVSGSTCIDRLGYTFSWSVNKGNEEDLEQNSVTNLIIRMKPSFDEDAKTFSKGDIIKNKGTGSYYYIEEKLGNVIFTSNRTKEHLIAPMFTGCLLEEQAYNNGYRIYIDPKDCEEKVPEYTMDQIVKLVGHNLKIKK